MRGEEKGVLRCDNCVSDSRASPTGTGGGDGGGDMALFRDPPRRRRNSNSARMARRMRTPRPPMIAPMIVPTGVDFDFWCATRPVGTGLLLLSTGLLTVAVVVCQRVSVIVSGGAVVVRVTVMTGVRVKVVVMIVIQLGFVSMGAAVSCRRPRLLTVVHAVVVVNVVPSAGLGAAVIRTVSVLVDIVWVKVVVIRDISVHSSP